MVGPVAILDRAKARLGSSRCSSCTARRSAPTSATATTRADPSYAFALSRLDTADFRHTPVGVFRQVEQASYDQLMAEQIDAARSRSGPGDLAALLAGNDTWEVG